MHRRPCEIATSGSGSNRRSIPLVNHVLPETSPNDQHIERDHDNCPYREEKKEKEVPDRAEPRERNRDIDYPGPPQEEKNGRHDERGSEQEMDPTPEGRVPVIEVMVRGSEEFVVANRGQANDCLECAGNEQQRGGKDYGSIRKSFGLSLGLSVG